MVITGFNRLYWEVIPRNLNKSFLVFSHVCVADKTLTSKLFTLDQFLRLKIAETLNKMVKDTVQSLNLENDKLKDKIQEIVAELRNLLDELAAKAIHLNGYRCEKYHGNSEQYQEDFKKYIYDRMSLIENSLKQLSSQVYNISSSLDQVLEYSYSYNIKFVGVPAL